MCDLDFNSGNSMEVDNYRFEPFEVDQRWFSEHKSMELHDSFIGGGSLIYNENKWLDYIEYMGGIEIYELEAQDSQGYAELIKTFLRITNDLHKQVSISHIQQDSSPLYFDFEFSKYSKESPNLTRYKEERHWFTRYVCAIPFIIERDSLLRMYDYMAEQEIEYGGWLVPAKKYGDVQTFKIDHKIVTGTKDRISIDVNSIVWHTHPKKTDQERYWKCTGPSDLDFQTTFTNKYDTVLTITHQGIFILRKSIRAYNEFVTQPQEVQSIISDLIFYFFNDYRMRGVVCAWDDQIIAQSTKEPSLIYLHHTGVPVSFLEHFCEPLSDPEQFVKAVNNLTLSDIAQWGSTHDINSTTMALLLTKIINDYRNKTINIFELEFTSWSDIEKRGYYCNHTTYDMRLGGCPSQLLPRRPVLNTMYSPSWKKNRKISEGRRARLKRFYDVRDEKRF